MRRAQIPPRMTRARIVLGSIAAMIIGATCTENLPSGPNTFAAHLAIVVPHDTLVVGDPNNLTAQATDASGHLIQGLSYTWTSSDTSVLGVATATTTPPATGDSAGGIKTFRGKHTGLSTVTLSLTDPRFVTSNAARTQTVVVGGVGVFSSHDSTLTAVSDTGVAIGMGLVRVNGALVKSPSQGIRWTHLGLHTAIVAAGDTIRYIARSNGVDTLIASDDFCLAGARCADTVIVRVSQQLSLALSAHSFLSWSFADTVGPTVILADRRGNGLAGTTVRFVPLTPADSAVVHVVPASGPNNPTTGLLAAPKLVSAANGSARVKVLGLGADGSVVATDSITDTVRQVARRVAVEPLRAVITANDSIPIRTIARDAHGATIADASIAATPVGIALNDVWAGPTPISGASVDASIIPTLTGIALPSNNPGAPQIPVIVDPSLITILQLDTVKAGATPRAISVTVLDSVGLPAIGRWIRFGSSFAPVPDSTQIDVTGVAATTWQPRDTAGSYTLTGVRGALFPLAALGDSLGRIVVRHSIVVVADVASALKSTLQMSATTIAPSGTAVVTVMVKDRFGNLVKNALPTDITVTLGAGGGTLGVVTCSQGVCTATYTAPAAPAADTISVKILGVEILFSPIAITIM